MILPDYQRSIVNLVSSIMESFEITSDVPVLEDVLPNELRSYKNIVLMVVDGVGDYFLKEYYSDSILMENYRGQLTSVFPSTTASAITSFLTGSTPTVHGITGWYTWMEKLASMITVLPFQHRSGGMMPQLSDELLLQYFSKKSIFEQMASQSYALLPKNLIHSHYSRRHTKGAKCVGIQNLGDMQKKMKQVITENNRKKYLYAYWPQYDHIAHQYGYDSTSARQHMDHIISYFEVLSKMLRGTSTLLLVTADHGFVNIEQQNILVANDLKNFVSYLDRPLAGESRLAYAYVKKGQEISFEKFVKDEMSTYCDLWSSQDLMHKGAWGDLAQMHPEFASRVGDYVLVMKEGYALRDVLPNEEMAYYRGRHGGVTANEMYVPLVAMKFAGKDE